MSCWIFNKKGFINLPLWKLFSSRNLLRRSYQALGPCFSIYSLFQFENMIIKRRVYKTRRLINRNFLLDVTNQDRALCIHLEEFKIHNAWEIYKHHYGFKSSYTCISFIEIYIFVDFILSKQVLLCLSKKINPSQSCCERPNEFQWLD